MTKIATIILAISSLLCFAVGCGESHEHVFTQKIASENFIATDATCFKKATYYYSCECGQMGTNTFENGDVLEHSFTNYLYNNDATCTENGTETAICDNTGCSQNHTRTKINSKLNHSFGDYISNNDGTHSKTCKNDNSHIVTEECAGGTATETNRPVCVKCESEYGATLNHIHNYNKQVATNKFLESEATCEEKAKYFYSCECGEAGTNVFYYGEKADHIPSLWIKDKDTTCETGGFKYKECTECQAVIETEVIPSGHNYVDGICTECGESDECLHVATEEVVVSPATCTEIGLKKTKCLVCKNFIAQEEIDILPHTESEWIIDTPVTCTVNGEKHIECTVCKTVLEEQTIIAKHDYIDGICSACDKVQGYTFELSSDNSYYTFTGIGGSQDKNIVIPSEYENLPVKAIGEKAFSEKTNVQSISIPNTINTIGTRAFYGCTGLTEITIPASVTSIGTQIFYKSNIETVYYNSTYASEDNPFLNVKNVIFGGRYIPSYMLYNCTSVQNVTIENSVTYIGGHAFINCSSLTKVNYTGTIDQWVEIDFDNGSSNPLYYAENLYINNQLVTDVALTTATKINNCAFYGYSSLTSITIPDSVTSIDFWAFEYCSSLTSITIPDSVTSIGKEAFRYCSSLTKVNYTGTIDQWVEIDFYGYYSNPLEYAKNLYINNKLVTDVVLTTATKIYDYAFSGYSSLTSITIPDSVTSIDTGAFSGCNSLTSITIPDSVTSIGGNAFSNCSSLTSVIIRNGVTSIGYQAFRKCSSLRSITIPDSVTSIGDYAFEDCSSLQTIYCEAESQPNGWSSYWRSWCSAQVVLGYKG